MDGFVYVWLNKLNGRYYIGSHKGSPDDGYTGSGKAFKRAVKKHGIENFSRTIDYIGPNFRQEETDLIAFFDACCCPLGYNLSHTERGLISDETRSKQSAARKGKPKANLENYRSEANRARLSALHSGKTISQEAIDKANQTKLERYGSAGTPGFKGGSHSEEHKQKMSKRMAGNQHTKGHKLSEEHKRKISEGFARRRAAKQLESNMA